MSDLTALADTIYTHNKGQGFWEGELTDSKIAEKLCLIHSEVSEALEDLRNDNRVTVTFQKDGKPEGFPSELVDVIIRVLDLAGALNIDIDAELKRKLKYNLTRPYKHGKKF